MCRCCSQHFISRTCFIGIFLTVLFVSSDGFSSTGSPSAVNEFTSQDEPERGGGPISPREYGRLNYEQSIQIEFLIGWSTEYSDEVAYV